MIWMAKVSGISSHFKMRHQGSQEELRYISVEIGPLIFKDDILEGSPGVIQARAANIRVVMREK